MSKEAERPTRAALYSRVSTKEQANDGDGLDRQREDLERHAERHGWEVVASFADAGVNGDLPLEDRPEAAKLLSLCRSGGVDVVAVAQTSRFGRDASETLNAEGVLKQLRVGLVVTEQGIDTRTGGRLTLVIHAGIAEDDKRQIKEKTERGKRALARKGIHAGGPAPFGFKVEDRRLAVREDEAAVIREAVALLVDHDQTTWEAAEALNALGQRPRGGPQGDKPRVWTSGSLRHVLRSPSLAGQWTYKCRRQAFDREDPAHIPVEIPAILAPDRRRDLLSALGVKATGPRTAPDSFYLLSRGLLTGECGVDFHGLRHGKRKNGFYRCCHARHDAGGRRCTEPMASVDQVDGAVWGAVTDLLTDPERLAKMASDFLTLAPAEAKLDVDAQIAQADQRLAKLETEKIRVADYLRQGIPAATVRQALADNATEATALRKYRQRLVAQRPGATGSFTGRSLALAAGAPDRLVQMTPRERRAVLDVLQVHVTLQGWHECPTCAGKGKLPGGTGGLVCPTCLAMRREPSLLVQGVVPLGDDGNVEHLADPTPRRCWWCRFPGPAREPTPGPGRR